jgi:hypothetical protein
MKHHTRVAGALLAGALFLLVARPAKADEPPAGKRPLRQDIANKVLGLTVYLPDAERGYYRGPRFDWSGLIARAEYRGHGFFGEWKTPHNPENHDDVVGPAEEFGMARPLGYDDARPGGTFVKIGIGELEKIDEPKYRFHHGYRIVRPGAWKVTSGPDWVAYRQELKTSAGYGYDYVKRISLAEDGPAFTVSHSLKNTGSKAIDTDHYCHNFILIDGDPVGPHYKVKFAFPARPKDRGEVRGPLAFREGEMTFRKDLANGDFYAELQGWAARPADNRVTVENTSRGAGLRIVGDTPLADFHVWGVRTALCPEPFIRLQLEPGKEAKWATVFTFFSREPGKGGSGR